MKKTILSTLFMLGFTLSGFGQMPSWTAKPTNDTIYVIEGTKMIRGDKKGKITIWNTDGKELYSTDQRLTKFHNGLATVLKKDGLEIQGVIDTSGKFTSLPHLGILYNHPYFENGYLIAKRRGKLAMYSTNGREVDLPDHITVYPFSKGYGVYVAYENPEKMKKPFYNFLKSNGEPLDKFILKENGKEKEIEPKNIRFISSVNEDGKSLAIIKNKLYWFDASDETLSPILMGDETEKKRHLVLASDKDIDFTAIDADKLTITAKYGKDESEEFNFDNRLRLKSDEKGDKVQTASAHSIKTDFATDLQEYQANGLYGLILDGKDSIPAQFEQVGLKYGKNAFVKIKGNKWGILELTPDVPISVKVNNGEEIEFHHKDYPSQIVIDLPIAILSKNVRIESADIPGSQINMESRNNRDTREGNFVTYDCLLSVPENLTDTTTNITFGTLDVSCENVVLNPIPLIGKGRYINPFSIEFASQDLGVTQGKTEFNVIVYNAEEDNPDEASYSANLIAENLEAECEKLSEKMYKCTLSNLAEGTYTLDFAISETGCPQCIFPLQLTCTKKGKASIKQIIPDNTAKVAEEPATETSEPTKEQNAGKESTKKTK